MAFYYREGSLKIGQQARDVSEIARLAKGPVYIYDLDDVEERADAFSRSLAGLKHAVHYAMKANSHREILSALARKGFGVDTVSGGEITRALEAGIAPGKIVFSGVAKTVAEIEFALTNRIKQINVESPQELLRIAAISERLGTVADVAFRLNPDVNPQTHPYITTGFRENKFGMDEGFVPELLGILASSKGKVRLRGLTMHIGSLLFDLEVFREAIEKTVRVHRRFVNEGYPLDRLDVGGGLGIRYETDDVSSEFALIESYGKMVRETLAGLDVEVLFEPGRILVGRCGLLVGEVQYIKNTGAKTFAILDTGMHHLLRPALYGARHRLLAVQARPGPRQTYDVVGPICESSDFLAKSVELSELRQGDLVAIADAGAYGFSMASRYNSHELPMEVFVHDGRVWTPGPKD